MLVPATLAPSQAGTSIVDQHFSKIGIVYHRQICTLDNLLILIAYTCEEFQWP